MNHEDRSRLGAMAKKCNERTTEVTLNDDGSIKGVTFYGKAKDFRRNENGNGIEL